MLTHTAVVTSPGGARIGFDVLGEGPSVVLVHGSTADRTRWLPVRDELARHFAVYLLDRRGRGLSTDEPVAYEIDREAEDLVAVAEAIRGPVSIVAHSYGATCALEALPTGAFARAVLYEPAFSTPVAPLLPPAAAGRIEALIRAGAPEEALEASFTEVIAAPPAVLRAARAMPDWPAASPRWTARSYGKVVRRGRGCSIPSATRSWRRRSGSSWHRDVAGRGSCVPGRPRGAAGQPSRRAARSGHIAMQTAPEQLVEAVKGILPR